MLPEAAESTPEMEGILEIRDGCNTPEQLLRSLAFARYLKIGDYTLCLTNGLSRHAGILP